MTRLVLSGAEASELVSITNGMKQQCVLAPILTDLLLTWVPNYFIQDLESNSPYLLSAPYSNIPNFSETSNGYKMSPNVFIDHRIYKKKPSMRLNRNGNEATGNSPDLFRMIDGNPTVTATVGPASSLDTEKNNVARDLWHSQRRLTAYP
ncbi:hypothetical protein ElyMa_001058400 [Elysia marginata]|uniref:Uncharacterized protein n=1 Tax=Elysia marginata TaxID=1093978 RepID=A0AAV4HNY2_9GAST|nr:hypothetical protein ElyMa_001058400 [Elysia marginata]